MKKRKISIVSINKKLNVFDEKIVFPDKQSKANEVLKRIGLPKQWMNENTKRNL